MEPMTFEEWKKQHADVLKRRREECQECGGRGKAECDYCHGENTCECCHGSGSRTCSTCYGDHPCPCCDESGRCPECDGGRIICPGCDPRRLYDAELERDKKALESLQKVKE